MCNLRNLTEEIKKYFKQCANSSITKNVGISECYNSMLSFDKLYVSKTTALYRYVL